MYSLIRAALFSLDAERSHDAALALIGMMGRNPLLRRAVQTTTGNRVPSLPCELCGIKLPNPVGLAAGLDKHATATAGFLAMGFGHVELGTVTPRPQPGNPRPRMFRLTSEAALINRMGFNSVGIEAFRKNFVRENRSGVIGINIGKNAATPLAEAADDYTAGLEFAHGLGDYVTMNVSSPNTQDLRALQSGDELTALLETVAEARIRLESRDGFRRPVLIKIAPDAMDEQTLSHIVEAAVATGINGIINTNTTVGRTGVEASPHRDEAGGLSGRPLTSLATRVNADLCRAVAGRLDVVACGGISGPQDAARRLHDGARCVQVYTGFIYQGPALVRQIVAGLEREARALHSSNPVAGQN